MAGLAVVIDLLALGRAHAARILYVGVFSHPDAVVNTAAEVLGEMAVDVAADRDPAEIRVDHELERLTEAEPEVEAAPEAEPAQDEATEVEAAPEAVAS